MTLALFIWLFWENRVIQQNPSPNLQSKIIGDLVLNPEIRRKTAISFYTGVNKGP